MKLQGEIQANFTTVRAPDYSAYKGLGTGPTIIAEGAAKLSKQISETFARAEDMKAERQVQESNLYISQNMRAFDEEFGGKEFYSPDELPDYIDKTRFKSGVIRSSDVFPEMYNRQLDEVTKEAGNIIQNKYYKDIWSKDTQIKVENNKAKVAIENNAKIEGQIEDNKLLDIEELLRSDDFVGAKAVINTVKDNVKRQSLENQVEDKEEIFKEFKVEQLLDSQEYDQAGIIANNLIDDTKKDIWINTIIDREETDVNRNITSMEHNQSALDAVNKQLEFYQDGDWEGYSKRGVLDVEKRNAEIAKLKAFKRSVESSILGIRTADYTRNQNELDTVFEAAMTGKTGYIDPSGIEHNFQVLNNSVGQKGGIKEGKDQENSWKLDTMRIINEMRSGSSQFEQQEIINSITASDPKSLYIKGKLTAWFNNSIAFANDDPMAYVANTGRAPRDMKMVDFSDPNLSIGDIADAIYKQVKTMEDNVAAYPEVGVVPLFNAQAKQLVNRFDNLPISELKDTLIAVNAALPLDYIDDFYTALGVEGGGALYMAAGQMLNRGEDTAVNALIRGYDMQKNSVKGDFKEFNINLIDNRDYTELRTALKLLPERRQVIIDSAIQTYLGMMDKKGGNLDERINKEVMKDAIDAATGGLIENGDDLILAPFDVTQDVWDPWLDNLLPEFIDELGSTFQVGDGTGITNESLLEEIKNGGFRLESFDNGMYYVIDPSTGTQVRGRNKDGKEVPFIFRYEEDAPSEEKYKFYPGFVPPSFTRDTNAQRRESRRRKAREIK